MENDSDTKLPVILEQADATMVPSQIWHMLRTKVAKDIDLDEFIQKFIPLGKHKLEAMNARRRKALDVLKHNTFEKAIRIANSSGRDSPSFELLKLEYNNQRSLILAGDFYHAGPTDSYGKAADVTRPIFPMGTITHDTVRCKDCRETESFGIGIWNHMKNGGKNTLTNTINLLITLTNFLILICILMNLPKTDAMNPYQTLDPERNLSTVTFTAFDCSSLNNITFLDHNETCTQRKSSLVKGMATLMTRDTVVKFPGFRCTGHRTQQFLYCGWDSTESIIQPDETYVLTPVSVDDCISMAVELSLIHI